MVLIRAFFVLPEELPRQREAGQYGGERGYSGRPAQLPRV